MFKNKIDSPLISIVVPVYNVETKIRRCIESIISQEYKHIEIILVDDGSTDSSSFICDEYANIDDRISVIHKTNGGLSSARNAGIDVAKGEYISFIDSDDYVSNRFISEMYSVAEKNDLDIVFCDYAQGKEENYNFNSIDENKCSCFSSEEILSSFAKDNVELETSACNKLYLTSLFIDNSIRFPYGILFEDAYTTHIAIYYAKKIGIVSSILYYYYQNEDSIMHGFGNNVAKHRAFLNIYYDRAKWFKEHNYISAANRLLVKAQKYIILFYAKLYKDKTFVNQLYKEFQHNMNEINLNELKLFDRVLLKIFNTNPYSAVLFYNSIKKLKLSFAFPKLGGKNGVFK